MFKLGQTVVVKYVGVVTEQRLGVGGVIKLQVEGRDGDDELGVAIVPMSMVTKLTKGE